nr:unnamed protein product [Digitaria exilis]
MQTASKISKDKCATLLLCLKEVIDKSLEVGADSSQFPENWIFHSREKRPGKAFVDGKKIDFLTVGGRTSAYVPELQKLDGADVAASGSKRREDKEHGDDKKSRKGTSSPKPAKGRVKEAKGSSGKAANASDDGDVEEEAKPAKRGRKQSARAAIVSTQNAGGTLGDEDSDEDKEVEEDAKPAKRGRKQIGKTMKSSSKDADDEDGDDEADDKIETKQGKRRGQKTQPSEAKSLPNEGQDAGPARRSQRKARQT